LEIIAEDISEDRVCMFGTLKEIVFFTNNEKIKVKYEDISINGVVSEVSIMPIYIVQPYYRGKYILCNSSLSIFPIKTLLKKWNMTTTKFFKKIRKEEIKAYLVRVSGLQNVENVLFLINDLNWVIIAPNQILHDVLEEIKDGN